MAMTHTNNARNAIANAVCALVNQGGQNASGQLVIFDAQNNVLAVLPLSNPAFGNAVDGTATANAVTSDPNPTVGGVPYRYEVQDCGGNWVFRGSCGPSGDLGFPSPIPSGAPAQCSGLFYQAPP